MDTVLGAAAIALDVVSEATEGFGPLKSILGVISAQYKVCAQPIYQFPF